MALAGEADAPLLPKLLSSERAGVKKGDAIGEKGEKIEHVFRATEVEVPSLEQQPETMKVKVPKGANSGDWVAFTAPDVGFGKMERMAPVPEGVKAGERFQVGVQVSCI